MPANQIEKLIESLAIMVVDESQYTRKLTRMMLQTIGAKTIFEQETASRRSTSFGMSILTS